MSRNHSGFTAINSSEYDTWISIRERCNNPNNKNYSDYGARGIKVCKRWDSKGGFERFLTDMGKRPNKGYSIERKNNNGPYSPKNCRWATMKEQKNNCRNTVWITWKGKTKTLADWSEITGVPLVRLKRRYYDGMPLDRMMDATKHRNKVSRTRFLDKKRVKKK